MNKAIVCGNLGKDPEIRYTTDGQAVANLRVATTRKWKDKRDEVREETTWHQVVVWGRSAEPCGKYLNKGDRVLVEGRISVREYTDRDGNKRTATEIVAENVQFLNDRRPSGGSSDRGRDDRDRDDRRRARDDEPRRDRAPSGGRDSGRYDDDDDIPF